MTLKTGDLLTWDGDEYEVTGDNLDAWWVKAIDQGNSYYYLRLLEKSKLSELVSSGQVKLGIRVSKEDNSVKCPWGHTWNRYTGAREVYNFCTHCGVKDHLDWKIIGEGKKK